MPTTCFAADAMLGRLARWLRVLGHDTFYDAGIADDVLVACAANEARVLLTRDRRLLRDLQPAQAIEIVHDAPLAQLQQVVTTLTLPPPAELFTRCMLCNCVLRELQGEERVRLPEDVQEIGGPVRSCPSCERVYWQGSHAKRMRAAIDRALPGWLI